MLIRTLLFCSVVVLSSSCIKRTPVMPTPLGTDEATQLQQALLGTCDVISSQKEGSSPRSEEGLAFIFGQDGSGGYNAVGIPLKFKYQVDGRNVTMSQGYEVFRVDDWSGRDLKLFVYELSTTWVCRKRRS